MEKNKLLQVYKTYHQIKFSQEYLMEIYHPGPDALAESGGSVCLNSFRDILSGFPLWLRGDRDW